MKVKYAIKCYASIVNKNVVVYYTSIYENTEWTYSLDNAILFDSRGEAEKVYFDLQTKYKSEVFEVVQIGVNENN